MTKRRLSPRPGKNSRRMSPEQREESTQQQRIARKARRDARIEASN